MMLSWGMGSFLYLMNMPILVHLFSYCSFQYSQRKKLFVFHRIRGQRRRRIDMGRRRFQAKEVAYNLASCLHSKVSLLSFVFLSATCCICNLLLVFCNWVYIFHWFIVRLFIWSCLLYGFFCVWLGLIWNVGCVMLLPWWSWVFKWAVGGLDLNLWLLVVFDLKIEIRTKLCMFPTFNTVCLFYSFRVSNEPLVLWWRGLRVYLKENETNTQLLSRYFII